MIKVTPGYVLGPYGDEIVIDCARTWDVRGGGLSGATGQPPVDYPDPWCSRVLEEQQGPVYIAVRYEEVPSRPVRVQPVGCGCNENQCVHSRWRDGYEFGVLTECPASHLSPSEGQPYPDPGTEGEGSESGDESPAAECPTCPPCPSDPWVVLARIEFDANGTIVDIDNCACRRLVISFASKWNTCDSAHASAYEAEPQTDAAATTPAPEQKAPEAATPPPEAAPRKTSRRRSQPEEPDTTQQRE